MLLAALGFAALGGCQLISQSHNAEGVRMYQQAYYEGALQQFQRALAVDPQNPDAYYNLGATHHQLAKLHHRDADYAQAESYYNQCIDKSPNHEECYRGLAVLLVDRGHPDQAQQLLTLWSQRSPSLPGPRIELARISEEQGDKAAAQRELIEAVTIDPHNARALTALGKLREESGDTKQALTNYQRSLTFNRNQPEVAARVAALQGTTSGGPTMTPAGGTRTVNINNSTPGAVPPSLLR
jgi:tetratricopeptide (TPR) repeat protein